MYLIGMLPTKLRKWFGRMHSRVQYFIHVKVGCVKTSNQPLSHILLHKSCCSDLIILETESGNAKSFVKKWQQTFLRKLSAHTNYEQSPNHQAIDLAKASKCEMGVYIEKLENLHQDPIQEDL